MQRVLLCKVCGIKIITKSHKRKYCDKCKVENGRKRAKERYLLKKDYINNKRKDDKEYKHNRKLWDTKYDKSIKGKLRRTTSNRKRRRQQYDIIETFTSKEWEEKVKKTKGICKMCNKNIGIEKLTLDHIYPISKSEKGRKYTIKDIQPI